MDYYKAKREALRLGHELAKRTGQLVYARVFRAQYGEGYEPHLTTNRAENAMWHDALFCIHPSGEVEGR